MREKIYEKDLYEPVKEYFEGIGYTVKSEVNGCDIAAMKDDELVITELKLNLNLDVILQAVQRQRMTSKVYIAVPVPKKYFSNRFKSVCTLLRRLEIGLILVYVKKDVSYVRLEHECKSYKSSTITPVGKKKKKKLEEEFHKRHGDNNTGGVNRQKLVTAYREDALLIAGLLKQYGPLSAKQLREMGASDKSNEIMHRNVYGWFENQSRGIYRLTDSGLSEIEKYSELVELLVNEKVNG